MDILNSTVAALSQVAQNGGGIWGSLPSINLPPFTGASPGPFNPWGLGLPWGGINTNNTNPYTGQPAGGWTRFYDFSIAECTMAPDGVRISDQLCVNGQFPGPLIEANYGDYIQVTVHNRMRQRKEGASLHWHGFLQKGTPWEDGVPSISQCPIAPGSSYTYRFRADLYGTSWYHSHYSAQYAGGVLGPIVIYGPADTGHDIDLGPIMLQDWFHANYQQLVEQAMAPIGQPGGPNSLTSNNVLINGKMDYDCTKTTLPCTSNAGIAKFNFRSGKSHKLRLVNTGAAAIQKFSIDNHSLTVIANDFVPIMPYTTDHVSLGIGQRADVLVNGTGASGSAFWMRSSMTGACSRNDGVSPVGLAAIYYDGADTNAVPTTNATYTDASPQACANPALESLVPTYPIAVGEPATTETINLDLKSNGTHMVYFINGKQHKTNFSTSLLQRVHSNDLAFSPSDVVHDYGTNSSVRLVIYNHDPAGFHPMHLHGHNFQVLHVGYGLWDGSVVRASNPQRRDTQLMPPAQGSTPSHLVIQWAQDNPGMWPLHCHLAFHLSAGLYMNVLERSVDVLQGFGYRSIPSQVDRTCRPWVAWQARNTIDTVDDGV